MADQEPDEERWDRLFAAMDEAIREFGNREGEYTTAWVLTVKTALPASHDGQGYGFYYSASPDERVGLSKMAARTFDSNVFAELMDEDDDE
jgi:hypothetical protein